MSGHGDAAGLRESSRATGDCWSSRVPYTFERTLARWRHTSSMPIRQGFIGQTFACSTINIFAVPIYPLDAVDSMTLRDVNEGPAP